MYVIHTRLKFSLEQDTGFLSTCRKKPPLTSPAPRASEGYDGRVFTGLGAISYRFTTALEENKGGHPLYATYFAPEVDRYRVRLRDPGYGRKSLHNFLPA